MYRTLKATIAIIDLLTCIQHCYSMPVEAAQHPCFCYVAEADADGSAAVEVLESKAEQQWKSLLTRLPLSAA